MTVENYVECAERVMEKKPRVTTTKLRNLLSLTADIYNRLQTYVESENSDGEWSDIQSAIIYLRVQFVYAAGRDRDVKDFIDASRLMEVLKAGPQNKVKALLLCRYLEALAAYKKYYDPKDK